MLLSATQQPMKKAINTILLSAIVCSILAAPAFTSKNSGAWIVGTNWDGNTAPSVPLSNNTSVTISSGDSIFYGDVFTVSNNMVLNVENNAILFLDGVLDANNNITINVAPLGKLVLNDGFVANNNSSVEINGTAQINGDVQVNGNSTFTVLGSLSVDGNIVASGSNNIVQGTGSLNVTGTVMGDFAVSPSVAYSVSTLPIELSFFTVAQLSLNEFEFKWETLSETNNDFFVIEYSENGYEWVEVATMDGAGNTTASIQYSFVAEYECYGTIAYFRLKQIDYDGTFSNSEMIPVALLIDDTSIEANTYPNPAKDHIIIDNINKDIESIYIFDIHSKLVDEIKDVKAGKVKYSFETDSEGIYYVGLKSKENTDVKQIVVKP